MKWLAMKFEAEGATVKTHVAPHLLAGAVLNEVIVRSREAGSEARLVKTEPVTEIYLDRPGMVLADRPEEIFDLMGLKVTIPCEDVDAFMKEIAVAEPRLSLSRFFAKVHARFFCLIVPAEAGERGRPVLEFVVQLSKRSISASQRAEEHLRAWEARHPDAPDRLRENFPKSAAKILRESLGDDRGGGRE